MKSLARKSVFSFFAAFVILFAGLINLSPAFAVPDPTDTVPSVDLSNPIVAPNTTTKDTEPTTEPEEGNTENPDETIDDTTDDPDATTDENELEGQTICQKKSGLISWIFCSALSFGGTIVDDLYALIESFLIVDPISTDHESPIFKLWQYTRNITNIVFVIFMLIVIYSQLTGFGISNYGIKRVLPRIIIAAVLVNLSYFLTVLAVDVSNIVGSSIIDTFTGIQESVTFAEDPITQIKWTEVVAYFVGGTGLAWAGITASGGMGHLLWLVALFVLSGLVSLIIGLITILLRQGVILVLLMIAPLAFVCYLLPNTEKWFQKWKDTLFQMLIFYPMFSFLFGASELASWALMASSEGDLLRIILGLGLRVLPLFLAGSMLKMSKTVLGKVSSALTGAAKPIYGGLGNWTGSHAERSRQKYLASNNTLNGSRLRNFLAYKQEMRNLEIDAGKKTFASRARTRALIEASSYKGRDKNGLDQYDKKASKTTRLLKEASLQETLAANAQKSLDNTLSEYGDLFETKLSGTKKEERGLGYQHGQAFLEGMMQSFRAENIAQADQSFLLQNYLNAKIQNTAGNSTAYNRLIANAAGGIGHTGESSIIGQVILRSSEIEGRRRREVGIVMNKFSVDKRAFRAMALNVGAIDDNGIELDENGKEIEDQFYRPHADYDAKHREWDKYIARHKTTGREIKKDAYDTLSDAEKRNYEKIRYMEIKDDKGNIIQEVYSDDAAYMKEMLIRDINIGDPINRRYNISYGTGDPTTNTKEGILRKYHSTISTEMLNSRYKEHAAEVTPMITSQANLGYINSMGQYHIANLQSLSVATKPGAFFQNDAYAINTWSTLIASLNTTEPGKRFEDLISDEEIASYRNVNGEHLKGLELKTDTNGKQYWDKVDPNLATAEQQRNYVKHFIIPRAARKLTGMLNRNITPNMSENIKPDGYDALINLANVLSTVGQDNFNEDLDVSQRLDPDKDIFDVKDYSTHLSILNGAKQNIQQAKTNYYANHPDQDPNRAGNQTPPPVRPHNSQNNGGVPFGGLSAPGQNIPPLGGNPNTQNPSAGGSPALNNLSGQLGRSNDHDNYTSNVSNIAFVLEQVTDILHSSDDFYAVSSLLSSYAHNNPSLMPIAGEIDNIISSIAYENSSQSLSSSFGTNNNYSDERLEHLESEIISYLNAYL